MVIPAVQKYPDVSRIKSIKLRVGELSGVVPECVRDYFLIAAEGTIAEGARIDIERIPIGIRCGDCGYEGPFEGRNYRCPKCGSANLDYLTRVIGYLKRVSSFSEMRQEEAEHRFYIDQ